MPRERRVGGLGGGGVRDAALGVGRVRSLVQRVHELLPATRDAADGSRRCITKSTADEQRTSTPQLSEIRELRATSSRLQGSACGEGACGLCSRTIIVWALVHGERLSRVRLWAWLVGTAGSYGRCAATSGKSAAPISERMSSSTCTQSAASRRLRCRTRREACRHRQAATRQSVVTPPACLVRACAVPA
eukprot:1302196-Pleurochrysis_carterae.AAC.3